MVLGVLSSVLKTYLLSWWFMRKEFSEPQGPMGNTDKDLKLEKKCC